MHAYSIYRYDTLLENRQIRYGVQRFPFTGYTEVEDKDRRKEKVNKNVKKNCIKVIPLLFFRKLP